MGYWRLRRAPKAVSESHGRTVIELLTATALALLVLTGVNGAVVNGLRWQMTDSARLETMGPARDFMDYLARDLRVSLFPLIVESGTGDLIIRVTENSDQPYTYTVRYHWNPADQTVIRTKQWYVSGATRTWVVARHVSALIFRPAPGNPNRVTTEITVEQPDPRGSGPQTTSLSMQLSTQAVR